MRTFANGRRVRHILGAIMLLLWCAHAAADDGNGSHGAQFRLLTDPGGELSFDGARAAMASRGQRLDAAALTGASGVTWVQVEPDMSPAVLHIGNAQVRTYTLYDATDGTVIARGGTSQPGAARPIFHPEFVVPLPNPVPPLLLALELPAGYSVHIDLKDPKLALRQASLRFLGDGFYYGSMLLMTLLTGCFAVFARDAHFARLAVTLATWTVTMAAHQGYAMVLLWPGLTLVNPLAPTVLLLATSAASTWFSCHFLAEGPLPAGWRVAFNTLLIAIALCALLVPVADMSAPAVWLLSAAGAITFGASVHCAVRGDAAAKYLLGTAVFSAVPFALTAFVSTWQSFAMFTGCAALSMVTLGAMQRVAERLRRTHAQSEANAARGQFLANMSHEMRTPLNAIIGFSNLCIETANTPGAPLSAELRRYLEQIERASKLLLGVVNDVLDFSKLEAGKTEVERIAMDVRNILDDTVQTLRPEAQARGLALICEIDSAIPARVLGDPGRLAQVLLNLTANAIKFTERGTVRLRVRHLAGGEQPQLRFEVEDTGIGITPDERTRLFSAFSQADASTTRRFGGTGLGLTISQQLVQLMGGSIDVNSIPGQGSRFWFLLPLEAAAEQVRRPASSTAAGPALAGRHVLVVEDNVVNQLLAQRILERAGVVVAVAADGLEAVRRVRDDTFDLILMDMQMPRMDGVAATREIRRLPLGAQVPIIAMTANALEGDRATCLAAGMNDYITKPLPREVLLERMAIMLEPDPPDELAAAS